MPFRDPFAHPGDRPFEPESDDPRVVALVAEIAQARGITSPWLVWSGLLPGEGDAASAATALVRRRWWQFNGEAERLVEIDEDSAVHALTWLIGNTMAYDSELMTFEQASAFAASYLALMPSRRRWFANSDDFRRDDGGYGWNPATDFTFDVGFVAVTDGRGWIAWFTDED